MVNRNQGRDERQPLAIKPQQQLKPEATTSDQAAEDTAGIGQTG
ncbi:hypothetical protein [Acetobacter aceti]|nr:hypothetical protein [Acetobacter aceti]